MSGDGIDRVPDARSAHCVRWCRAIASIKEPAVRIGYVRTELTRLPIGEVAPALDELCGRAEQADPVAREVLASMITVLADPALAKRVADLREAAAQHALLPLGRLLRRRAKPQPGVLVPEDPDDRPATISGGGRPLTLGERKALARKPTRAMMDKLLCDPHPAVIRNLLNNPRVTEDDVVRLAARRPALPDIIAEIARHRGWSHRPRVRMAIVQNPGSPAELAVPMVRLLIRPELLQLLAAADVPAIVRAAAKELLERRPPVPDKREPGPPQ